MAGSVFTPPGAAASRQSCKPFAYTAHPDELPRRATRPYFVFFLGLSIVPVHFFEPQWQAQIFFRRAVCGSSRVMP